MQEALKMVKEAAEAPLSGRVFMPFGGGDPTAAVLTFLEGKPHRDDLVDYVRALKAVWPQLFKADWKAALLVACDVYLAAAEIKGFAIEPENLVRGFESGNQAWLHGNATGDVSQATADSARVVGGAAA